MTRTRAALLATAMLLALAACSSDDEPDQPVPTTPDEQTTEPEDPTPTATETETEGDGDTAALEEAVRAYTDLYFAPDADAAYDMLSARCQDTITPDAYQAVIDRAADDYGQLEVETFTVDELAGDMARVTYTVGLPLFDDELAGQPWVRESGEWRYDAC